MNPKLTQWLACPACGGDLALLELEAGEPPDVEQGLLSCSCRAAYPVFEGVPRLLDGALAGNPAFLARWRSELESAGLLSGRALAPPSPEFESLIAPTRDRFGKEWGEHPLQETTWGLDQATRLEHALRYLGWSADEARDRVVLDAGCGTGKLTCGMANWGGEAIGLDLQPGLVRGWRARRALAGAASSNLHMVQGSVLAPPFKPGVIDGLHSAGVLHHTPDTRSAFHAVAPLVKPAGSMGVWLYLRGRKPARLPWLPFVEADWASIPGAWVRPVTTRMPPDLLFKLLTVYATVFHLIYTTAARLRGQVHHQTIGERTTSLYDTYSPPYVWDHTVAEVSRWFEEEGFVDPVETTVPGDAQGFCVTARKAPV